MKTTKTTCQHCKQSFEALDKELTRGNAKFCSRACVSKARKKQKTPNVVCDYCNKKFYKRPAHQKNSKSGLFFCSRKHKDLSQRITNISGLRPPNYKHGQYTNYRTIAFENHLNKCNRCDYNKFKNVLIVHHIDRNRSNNDPSNLEILCPTCHIEEHYIKKDGPFTHLSGDTQNRTENSAVQKQCYPV